ncbi:hypothetical protein M8C21_015289, partial [Ambrosia artemisiifolia]
ILLLSKVFKQIFTIMVFSRTHLITSFFLVFMIHSVTSLTFNLTNIGPSNQNRDIVSQGEGSYISNDGIQVTPDGIGSDRSQKAGRATYIRPLHLWDNRTGELASFSTNFTFVIDSNREIYYGDGLTFFLAQNNSVISPGGAMGLPVNSTTAEAISRFVAVEFDTFGNDWDPIPRTNVSMGDHVGISISSLASVRSQRWLSNVTDGRVCRAWIRYDSVSNNLSVSFTGFLNGTAVRQDGLVYTVDLRRQLPEWVIFGFSAATGAQFQKNNVRSWTFDSSDLQVDQNNEEPPNTGLDSVEEKNSKLGLVVGIPVGVIFLSIIAFALWRNRRKVAEHEEEEENSVDVEMNNEFETGTGAKRYSYHELANSTGNFAEKEKLGEGGFGGVYKGFLKESSTYIAVKRVSKSSKQGMKEYASEVKIISRLRHRNLVQLIGWCHQKGELLLVYEHMENGSLDSHLFKGKSLLTWETRYRILVDHDKGSQTTMLAGTLGYMAPECLLTEWVWELYGAGTLLEGVDPSLGSDFDEEEIKRLMIVGLWCVHPDSESRPSMRHAIKVLNSEASIPLLPPNMPVASYLTPTVSSLFDVSSILQYQSSSSTSNIESSKQTTSSI